MIIKQQKERSTFACAGSLFINMTVFDELEQDSIEHIHYQDHFTFIPPGSHFSVEANGNMTDFIGPCLVYIKKGTRHRFISRKANSVTCCLFALHQKDNPGEIITPDMVPEGVHILEMSASMGEGDNLESLVEGFKNHDKEHQKLIPTPIVDQDKI